MDNKRRRNTMLEKIKEMIAEQLNVDAAEITGLLLSKMTWELIPSTCLSW